MILDRELASVLESLASNDFKTLSNSLSSIRGQTLEQVVYYIFGANELGFQLVCMWFVMLGFLK